MFEKTISSQSAFAPGVLTSDDGELRRSESIRRIDWRELSARIMAARDLRREMQLAMESGSDAELEFENAIAEQFASQENHERSVNRDALGGRKACSAISPPIGGGTAKGEKENNDD